MADISREYLEEKRRNLQDAILQFQGAIAVINDMIAELFPEDIPAETEPEEATG
jgi:hypothetical protein